MTNTTTQETLKIADLLPWSKGKRIETRRGPRMLRTATPTEDFWAIWRSDKVTLKEAGISLGKDGGTWAVKWWEAVALTEKQIADKVVEDAARAESLTLSKATDADVEIPTPPTLSEAGINYLPFQRAGIVYGRDRKAILIGDEMGLGKTIQAIGIWNSDPQDAPALVVCPASLRLNWKKEFEKWAVRPVRVAIVNGGGKTAWPEAGSFDVLVINYDVCGKHKAKLDSTEWGIAILDEAHYLKNPKSARTVALYGRKKSKNTKTGVDIPAVKPLAAAKKICLTGTPLPNRVVELFPMIQFLDPDGLGKDFFKYAMRYCDAKRGQWGWDFSGSSNLGELQTELRSRFMVRRLKADVLTELPAKRRQVISIPSNGSTGIVNAELEAFRTHEETLNNLAAYLELAKCESEEAEAEARSEYGKKRGLVIAEMTKLRQEVALAKVEKAIPLIEDALGYDGAVTPLIVFAHHKAVQAKIVEAFPGRCALVNGDTKLEDRQAAVDAFQNGEIDLIVGGFGPMGTGWTLTRSSHVMFIELDWVPGNLTQAEDRAHRIGQLNSVLVQHVVLEGSLDEIMAEKLVKKQDVIDRALDRETGEPEPASEPVELTTKRIRKITVSRDEIHKASLKITPEQSRAALDGMKALAGVCDGAASIDDMGFSGCDVRIGHSLAAQGSLSPRQTVLAAKLCRKYRRQLGDELVAAATGKAVAD